MDGFQYKHFISATVLSAVVTKSYETHQTQKQIENRNWDTKYVETWRGPIM